MHIQFESEVPLMVAIPDSKEIKRLQEILIAQEAEANAARQRTNSLDASVSRFSADDYANLINQVDAPYSADWKRTHVGPGVEVWAEDGGIKI